ncbi:hypothetical protein [Spiroplasma endosymbiont of Eupeodes luniger]|uniref:hypothetical protein n=1 Tax=Spiroplasma endosymbiont of Eupeodes luniger TaxID=3066300 RepID=UPI0030CED98C
MSWLVIAFIGLVPLGVFFDIKQPPKPNMEQSFMKREKRATNPSNGEIYEFSLSKATINWQDSSSKRYLVGFSNFNKAELVNLPENMIYSITWYPSFRFTKKTISDLLTNVYDLTKPGKIDAINIKGKIHSYNTGTSETGIGADWQYDWLELMFISSPLPEKDNEQPLPTAITKNDGEYQYNQFQDKLDYLMIQRRDFDKFNYSYLYWVPIFNFFDDNFKYMSEISIKLNGFKQNSKFNLSRKTLYDDYIAQAIIFTELSFSSFGDVITIKTNGFDLMGGVILSF